jgi:hypothetical protein
MSPSDDERPLRTTAEEQFVLKIQRELNEKANGGRIEKTIIHKTETKRNNLLNKGWNLVQFYIIHM